MAYRILFIFFGIILAVNIVLSVVGLIFGVNLYQKYTKQILIFFASLIFLIIAGYFILALVGLVD